MTATTISTGTGAGLGSRIREQDEGAGLGSKIREQD
jgi:hypothetical protein